MEIGEYIKRYREEHNLSLRDFAKLCNVTHSAIDYIEKGSTSPSLEMLSSLSKVLSITFIVSPNEPLKWFDAYDDPSIALQPSKLSQDIIDFIKEENEGHIRLAWLLKEIEKENPTHNALDNKIIRKYYDLIRKKK